MINLNKQNIRVRCLECKEEHFMPMVHIGMEKAQRSLGYEYEHTYRAEMKCSNCGDDMRIVLEVDEYPKNWVNYAEISNQGCLEMDGLKWDNNLIEI